MSDSRTTQVSGPSAAKKIGILYKQLFVYLPLDLRLGCMQLLLYKNNSRACKKSISVAHTTTCDMKYCFVASVNSLVLQETPDMAISLQHSVFIHSLKCTR